MLVAIGNVNYGAGNALAAIPDITLNYLVPDCIQLFIFCECNAHAVDAVAITSWCLGSVFKNVAQV
jgi:hypothetical protein